MFDRRLLYSFDWGFLIIVFTLCFVGGLTLYSVVEAEGFLFNRNIYIKQLIWYGSGFVIAIIIFFFNYKLFDKLAYIIYGLSIILLICVLIFGKHVAGARRWIDLGFFSFQPSEFAKIGLIIPLAKHYAKTSDSEGLTFSKLVKPLTLTLLPFFLIARQPDLGTAMLLVLIAGSMTIFVKIEKKTFSVLVAAGAVISPIIWFFLKDYQKLRVFTFLSPERDPLGTGYHIIQSKIAIGSGMLAGKGFMEGKQNALLFLPEHHTDFIFSVIAEEWGFIGSIAILFLFLLLIFWGFNIAYSCRDSFGAILCVGVIIMITWQVVVNIGMTMGLMPVVGIPLPFISYGGSSVLTVMIGVGILLNVSMRGFMYE
ncbi:MAG: rod shape-determining protein RodA [Deltaproteobacteria bacterium]|nr:rod shape-determining protein RodA [Deltaproteobacteria bacterium]